MKGRKTLAGIVALAAIIALSWLVVPTPGADDRREHEGDNKFEHRALKLLNSILATRQGILANLGSLLTGLDNIVVKLDGLFTQVDGLKAECSTPDVVPLPLPGGGFCRIDAQGRLHVPVYNQGGGAAGPSQTLVVFRATPSSQNRFVDTDPLAGFTGTDLVMDIPEGCFGGVFGAGDINVCKFQIAVDARLGCPFPFCDVAESNELNNTAAGACQGLL